MFASCATFSVRPAGGCAPESGCGRGRRSQPRKQRRSRLWRWRWCRFERRWRRGGRSQRRCRIRGHSLRRCSRSHWPLTEKKQRVAAADFLGLVRVPKIANIRATALRVRGVGGARRQVLRARQVLHAVRWCRQRAGRSLHGAVGRRSRWRAERGERRVGGRGGRFGNQWDRVGMCRWCAQGQCRDGSQRPRRDSERGCTAFHPHPCPLPE
jgi:hypothetical protein